MDESFRRGARLLLCFSRCCEARDRGDDPDPFWHELLAVAEEPAEAGDTRSARAADHILRTYGPERPNRASPASPAK